MALCPESEVHIFASLSTMIVHLLQMHQLWIQNFVLTIKNINSLVLDTFGYFCNLMNIFFNLNNIGHYTCQTGA